MRKNFLLLVTLCLLLVLPVAVQAEAENKSESEEVIVSAALWTYDEEDTAMLMDANSDALEDFYAVLTEGIQKRQTRIDLSGFSITGDTLKAVFKNWVEDHPEMYYVDKNYQYSRNGLGAITALLPIYLDGVGPETAETFEAAVQEALKCVLPGMDDVQKALVLHDWIVQNVVYDETLQSSRLIYTAYGALVNHYAVCEGYARAYQLLLHRCGIDCKFITSDAINHAWNVVKIGGNWYHVDTTWDDHKTGSGRESVLHRYFLCSDSAFGGRKHNGWVMKVTCDDTAFDNAFWYDVESPLPFFNAEETWYVRAEFSDTELTNRISLIRRSWKTGAELAAAEVYDHWTQWDEPMSIYVGAFTQLNAWYGSLYFNDSRRIYRFDPLTGETETVFTCNGSQGFLYGLQSRGDVLAIFLNTAPNDAGTWYNSGLRPVIPPVCTYDAETRSVFINAAFAGDSAVLCAGYDGGGRLLYACFLTPEESAVLPVAAESVRVFRLGAGYAPTAEVMELTA